jgi:membrane protease YdiL (CAAX protease family)
MNGLWLSLVAVAVYMGTIGAASLSFAPTDASSLYDLLVALLPYHLAADVFVLCIATYLGGMAPNGFGTLRWKGVVWLLPAWLVLAAMYANIIGVFQTIGWPKLETTGWALLFAVPLLIATGEETMFRGVLLRQGMKQMSVTRAMVLSTVLFGLLHLIGGVFGQGVGGTTQHVLFTLLVGFFLAPIAVRTQNLWPLIIWHWLWNVAVFASQAGDILHPLILIGIAAQAAISGWLWRDLQGR